MGAITMPVPGVGGGAVGYMAGAPIFVSPLLPMAVPDKRRLLPPKFWHARRGYSARIQKKWDKRWPPIKQPPIDVIKNVVNGQAQLHVSQAVWLKLRQEASRGD